MMEIGNLFHKGGSLADVRYKEKEWKSRCWEIAEETTHEEYTLDWSQSRVFLVAEWFYIMCVWQTKSGHVTLAPQRPIHRPMTPSSSQKFVVMATPPPPSAGASAQSLASSTPGTLGTPGNQVMRIMPPTSTVAAATTPKHVVVSFHSSTDSSTSHSLITPHSSDNFTL